jgi:hypothetical protein
LRHAVASTALLDPNGIIVMNLRLCAAAAIAAATLSTVTGAAFAQAGASRVVASIDPSRGADFTSLRALAWRGDPVTQMSLANRLSETARRGGDDSMMVEAAYWAGRAWNAPRPVEPAAMAAFVAANCGSPAIVGHWVCGEGE